jgi:hypothetical protein
MEDDLEHLEDRLDDRTDEDEVELRAAAEAETKEHRGVKAVIELDNTFAAAVQRLKSGGAGSVGQTIRGPRRGEHGIEIHALDMALILLPTRLAALPRLPPPPLPSPPPPRASSLMVAALMIVVAVAISVLSFSGVVEEDVVVESASEGRRMG